MAFGDFGKKAQRQIQRDYYNKTKQNANAPRRDANQKVNKKNKTQADPEWYYLAPTWAISVGGYLLLCLVLQYFSMMFINLPPNEPDVGFFHMNGLVPWYFILALPVIAIVYFIAYKKIYAIWFNNNAMNLTSDIEEYANDAYIRTMDHLTQELDVAPDVGLGFDGHVSTLMGHAMISNKGIKKIDVPIYDPTVDGFVKRDEDGNIVTKKMPMFDEELADTLFSMSGVPQKFRILHDATDYEFNSKLKKNEGGDGKKRSGAYGRMEYDTLADVINNEFYPLDTETARPAGVYFYDSRPVNTVLIAITRGGKGCFCPIY